MGLFGSSASESVDKAESAAENVTENVSENVDEGVEGTKQSDLFLLASFASILYSMFQYYVKGDSERALFVGQWPQTILAVAIYLRLRRED